MIRQSRLPGVAATIAVTLLAAIGAPIIAQAQPIGFSEESLLLEGLGFNAALLGRFEAGKPAADDDRAAQISMMAALRQVAQLDLDRYAQTPAKPAELGESSQGRLRHVRGKLKSIKPIELTDDEVGRLYPELDNLKSDDPRRRLFLSEVTADDGGPSVSVVSMRMPSQLVPRDGLDERVAVQGLLVKNAGTAEAPHPVLYARRLAWYPRTPLGDLGMDYSLYDDVRLVAQDLKLERETFYQLLSTMRKADQAALFAAATANYDAAEKEFTVVPLFNDPASTRGKLVTLVGTARRAIAVVVNDPDIVERYGITKYYEVAIFTSDSQQNPILFDLLELPPGFPEGENIHVVVKIAGTFLTGFYYKRDPTPDERLRNIDPEQQKAPLLIGKGLTVVPQRVPQSYFEWIFAMTVTAAFLALVVGVWRMTKGERRTREILQKQMAPPPGTSLNDAPIETQPPVDLTGLHVPEPNKDDASR
jgi:hypothetical protein